MARSEKTLKKNCVDISIKITRMKNSVVQKNG